MSYSYSQLQAAYRCNKYYKMVYIDKLRPVTQKNSDLEFGSAVHFAIEQYFEHGADIVDAFKAYWNPLNVQFGRYKNEELIAMAETLLPRFVRLHSKKIKIHEAERRLYGKLGDIGIEGTPDVLGLYNGIPSVIDYKTASYRYPKEKIMINEQMYLYAELAKQNGYTPQQIAYIVLIKGKDPSIQVLTRSIDEKELNDTLDNLKIQCKNLDRLKDLGEWSVNTNSCQMGERKCDFFDVCWGSRVAREDKSE